MPPPPLTAGPDESCDLLSKRLRIIQRKKGHRASSDDLLLAWAVLAYAPNASTMLDLGTGKGTVALLALSVMPRLKATGIEALAISAALASRNIRLNGMTDRFSLIEGDVREQDLLPSGKRFDVITGAPPFMKVGAGTLPQDEQRAAGRFELRGGVEDYHRTASRKLTLEGRCIVLMDGLNADRNVRAAQAAGLYPIMQINVMPRPGRAPTYSLCVSQKTRAPMEVYDWSMRNAEGNTWSAAYTNVRQQLDLP